MLFEHSTLGGESDSFEFDEIRNAGETDEIRQILAAQDMPLISKASIHLPGPPVWLAKLFEVLKVKDHAAMPMIA